VFETDHLHTSKVFEYVELHLHSPYIFVSRLN
jgi:hypothetical protein